MLEIFDKPVVERITDCPFDNGYCMYKDSSHYKCNNEYLPSYGVGDDKCPMGDKKTSICNRYKVYDCLQKIAKKIKQDVK